MSIAVIALDVGGSSVKSGLVQDFLPPGEIRRREVDSAASAEQIGSQLSAAVCDRMEWMQPGEEVRIGIGFPGPCDYGRGISRIRGLSKFDTLYGLSIPNLLREHLPAGRKYNIRMRNDAEAAIVAEARSGAGRGRRHVLGITLGSGMGSANVIDGTVTVLPHRYNREGWLYSWPAEGETPADELFSARGLMRMAREQGIRAESPKELFDRAASGEARLRELFRTFGVRLGRFLSEVTGYLRPDLVLLLGGISRAHQLFIADAAAQLSVPIVPGELGDAAALLGAAQLFS